MTNLIPPRKPENFIDSKLQQNQFKILFLEIQPIGAYPIKHLAEVKLAKTPSQLKLKPIVSYHGNENPKILRCP
ncbi:hypothetical protein MC7420_2031 [Coleofasciculus chthonoplastes PCC 7420]|uniref:Uncharacterized protein n=1 Tax=Coleofasciculus chthonoplastes PCC 7420 TaxID=118168 RepID=B4VME0_9CYAN|nr:hypothetical protein [Coleofasciculus chthonoplastes]EDX77028.1 hypothetical protein MC7420_2031 [Coleofasciculus chthonoplastes PCC 7420]